MEIYTPRVIQKIRDENVPTVTFGPQFFITGFLYTLPFEMAVRVWDCFWLLGYDYFYAVALAIFKITQDRTLSMSMEQLMLFLSFKRGKKGLTFDVDQLISTSINL